MLVGKGITFDSGGLSLKPSDGMVAMKADMARRRRHRGDERAAGPGVPVRVTGLVAAAENMPSGSALRPGDVIRHYGGTTVEVLNTDAEGRLVLADALAYADAELDPDYLVDLATLTGAATLALSRRMAALFTDDEMAAKLLAAGDTGGDRLWRMPLIKDYRTALDSPVADLANVAARQHQQRRRHHRGPVPAGVRRVRGAGPTSTWPARQDRAATSTRTPRAAPATASASCCAGWNPCADKSPAVRWSVAGKVMKCPRFVPNWRSH